MTLDNTRISISTEDMVSAVLRRIVCAQCLKVATVHHVGAVEPHSRGTVVWAECHAVHVISRITVEACREVYDRRSSLVFQSIEGWSVEQITDMLRTLERRITESTDAATVLLRYLEAAS